MRGLRLLPILAAILIATSFASVFAAGYNVAVPILGTTGAPALSGTQYTGIINVLYADGMPVVLGYDKVTLQICSSSCITQVITFKQTAPGTYAYSFAPPSTLTGTVTIIVPAGALADDNGRVFPAVDTQIGTYAAPPLSSSSAPVQPALPANPLPQQSSVIRQAVASPQPSQLSPVMAVVVVITVLMTAGALLVLPRRR